MLPCKIVYQVPAAPHIFDAQLRILIVRLELRSAFWLGEDVVLVYRGVSAVMTRDWSVRGTSLGQGLGDRKLRAVSPCRPTFSFQRAPPRFKIRLV